jgi:hypothetical protein
VDPVPDPLLLRKSRSAGNRTRTSGSVAKNSDHQTTEAVCYYINKSQNAWNKKGALKMKDNSVASPSCLCPERLSADYKRVMMKMMDGSASSYDVRVSM